VGRKEYDSRFVGRASDRRTKTYRVSRRILSRCGTLFIRLAIHIRADCDNGEEYCRDFYK
jgi:hypothetical protein